MCLGGSYVYLGMSYVVLRYGLWCFGVSYGVLMYVSLSPGVYNDFLRYVFGCLGVS